VQQDANYNVTAITDALGNVRERYALDPYGGSAVVLTASWGQIPASLYSWVYLHQGGRYDSETGLYDFRNRFYDPEKGRWLNLDPLGFDAGDSNLYRYEGDGPTNTTDPTGLGWFDKGWDPKDVWTDRFTANDRLRWLRLQALGAEIVTKQNGNSRPDFNTNTNIDVDVTDALLDQIGRENGVWNFWAVDMRGQKILIWIDANRDATAASSLRSAMAHLEWRLGLVDITKRPLEGSTLLQTMQQVIPGFADDWREGIADAARLAEIGAEWNAAVFGGGFVRPGFVRPAPRSGVAPRGPQTPAAPNSPTSGPRGPQTPAAPNSPTSGPRGPQTPGQTHQKRP
jgi:RHS repeat-associated protein